MTSHQSRSFNVSDYDISLGVPGDLHQVHLDDAEESSKWRHYVHRRHLDFDSSRVHMRRIHTPRNVGVHTQDFHSVWWSRIRIGGIRHRSGSKVSGSNPGKLTVRTLTLIMIR
uniref:Uncharacterized protein n=1 Tax=Cacopsylla melanoneura TaxID=428564 RepID=A0A8D8T9U4_9HEMI